MSGPGSELDRDEPPEPVVVIDVASGAETSLPTRKLCAFVYVNGRLRHDVHRYFTSRRNQAWAPCYAVDLVAVLRHTARANRLVTMRDVSLLLVLLADLTVLGFLLSRGRPWGFALEAAVLLAAVAARAVLQRRKKSTMDVLRWVVGYRKGDWRGSTQRGLLVLGIVIAASTVVVLTRVGRECAAVVAAGFATAWLCTVGFSVRAHLLGRRAIMPSAARGRPPRRVSQRLETRAGDINKANLLVYSTSRARTRGALGTFVGAGHRLSYWTTPPVDVTVGAPAQHGGVRLPPRRVSVVELHEMLERTLRTQEVPGFVCEHRVYADGMVLPRELRQEPPPTRVSAELIRRGLTNPGDFHRTYLCLQVTSRDGDNVVSMFVRAELRANVLQLEVSVHVLPGVQVTDSQLLTAQVDPRQPTPRSGRAIHVPHERIPAIWSGVREGTVGYWAALFAGLRGGLDRPVKALGRAVSWHTRVVGGAAPDLGADLSLREYVALGQRLEHEYAQNSTAMEAARLQSQLVHAVADYLTDHGVDIRDFAGRAGDTIIHNQQTVIDTLNAGAVTFGDNAPARGTLNQNVRQPSQATP